MLEYFALANPPRRRSYPGSSYGRWSSAPTPKRKKRRTEAQKRATAKLVAASKKRSKAKKRSTIEKRFHKARLASSAKRSSKSRSRNLSAAQRWAAGKKKAKKVGPGWSQDREYAFKRKWEDSVRSHAKKKSSKASGARRKKASSSVTKPKRSRKARGKGASSVAKKRRSAKQRAATARMIAANRAKRGKRKASKGSRKRKSSGKRKSAKRVAAGKKAARTRKRNRSSGRKAARRGKKRKSSRKGKRRSSGRRRPRLSAKVRGRSRKKRVVYVKGARRAKWRRRGKTGGILVLRNPGGGGLAGFKANLKALLKPDNYVDAAQVALGIGASLAGPVLIARYSGKSQLNRGILGVLASGVSSAAAASILAALGQHKLAGRVFAGGLVGTTLKLAFQFVPSGLMQKLLPLNELRNGGGAASAAPASGVSQFIAPGSISGMNDLLTPSSMIAGEAVFGGGMRDYLELGMNGVGDYMEFNSSSQLPQIGVLSDAVGGGGERF